MNEYRLEVGDAVIGLICPGEEYARSVSAYFGVPASERDPDITLNLDFIFHEGDISIPESLFTDKSIQGKHIDFARGTVLAELGPGADEIKLTVKNGLTHGPATRVFEQLLYQAYYSCRSRKHYDSLLIHCSGVIYRGDGFIFVGPSGSGKSTITALSAGHHVLNDEICLLTFRDGAVTLDWTPFNGFFKDKREGSARLRSIFLIEHGTVHAISGMKKSDAVTRLAKEIVPPIALHEPLNQKVFIEMIDLADRLHSAVPVLSLKFKPDGMFWSEIDRQFYSPVEKQII